MNRKPPLVRNQVHRALAIILASDLCDYRRLSDTMMLIALLALLLVNPTNAFVARPSMRKLCLSSLLRLTRRIAALPIIPAMILLLK